MDDCGGGGDAARTGGIGMSVRGGTADVSGVLLNTVMAGSPVVGRRFRNNSADATACAHRSCPPCDGHRVMENPPRNVCRAVERDIECEDAPVHPAADAHISGDDVAVDVTAVPDDEAVGIDPTLDVAVHMDFAVRIEDAPDLQRPPGYEVAALRRRGPV